MPTPYFSGQNAIQIASPALSANVREQIVTVANNILPIALGVAGIAAVFFLVLAGLRYITAGSNPDRAKQGRAGLIQVVIGIVIIVATFSIIKLAVEFGQQISQ